MRTLLKLSLLILLLPFSSTDCGMIWGQVAYQNGAQACQNPVVTGSCGGSPPFTLVQAIPGAPNGPQEMVQNSSQSRVITNTAGNLLVAYAYAGQTPGGPPLGGTAPNMTFMVSDTKGNQYYAGPLFANKYNDSAIQIFYAPNIKGGANTVTATSAGVVGGPWTGLWLEEYSGIAITQVVDITSGKTAPAVTASSTPGNMTIRNSCDLVVFASINGHVSGQAMSVSAGFTQSSNDWWDPGAGANNLPAGSSFGASVNPTFTYSVSASDAWVVEQMAFRAANTQPLCQPTQLAFVTPPQIVNHGTCSGIVTIQSQDSNSSATPTSTGLTIALSGAGLVFYADSTCTYPITSIFVGSGMSSTSFYYKAASAGSPAISGATIGYSALSQIETSL